MSHNIDEERYIGAVPAWHHLGITVGDTFKKSNEMISQSVFDFTVEEQPLYTQDGQQVAAKATVRSDKANGDPERILGIVGPDYVVVQNHEAFEFFDSVVQDDLAIYESIGVLNGGSTMFVVAKLPKKFFVMSDLFEQYVTITNSHDGTRALRIFITPVRVVCQNTLNMALKSISAGVCLRHTKNVKQKMLDSAEVLGLADSKFQEVQQMFEHLARKPISAPLFDQYVTDVFPSTGENANQRTRDNRDGVIRLFDADTNRTDKIAGTWYAAAQSVVEFVDHNRVAQSGRDDLTSYRAAEALFGSGVRIKKRAIDLAVQGAK